MREQHARPDNDGHIKLCHSLDHGSTWARAHVDGSGGQRTAPVPGPAEAHRTRKVLSSLLLPCHPVVSRKQSLAELIFSTLQDSVHMWRLCSTAGLRISFAWRLESSFLSQCRH